MTPECVRSWVLFLVAALLTSPGIAADRTAVAEWSSIHGSPANQRYVPFGQINRRTIHRLGAVWISEPFPKGATSRMTPLVHAGSMYFAAGPSVIALEARTGKVQWIHQTETRAPSQTAGFEAMTSGLAIIRSLGLGLGDGMIFAGMMNGHLIALREKTGERVWDQLINEEPLPVSKGIANTPLYVDGVLYFGFGPEFTRGRAVAVEASSGRVLWRVSTVAEPGQPHHDSWPADSTVWHIGGAHPWAPAASDPALGLVYFTTGNPGPPSGGSVRAGDNLYANCLIALDMHTGALRWYRQLVHHDIWESDLGIAPVLFDFRRAGRVIGAIAAMRPDGYLFVFDRTTGEPLIPVDERPVAQNPRLFTAPTQPFPRGSESIFPPCESLSSQVPAGFVLGCMFDPPALDRPNMLAQGASARLAPMSYSPRTGYFYTQGQNSLQWRAGGEDPYFGEFNVNGTRVPGFAPQTVVVAAIEARTGKVKWRKTLPSVDDSGYRSNGGSLSTGGDLVFHQGGDGTLQAYDARNGATLWRFQTDFAAGDAAPMSYELDGKQYVAFIAGSKVWTFALDGTLPPAPRFSLPPHEEVVGPIEDATEIETATLEQLATTGRRYNVNEHAFNPYRARVHAGTPVTFVNNGHEPLTIVARDGSWTTGRVEPAQVATVTFDKPGSYLYFAKEYPWAYGQLLITPAATSPDSAASGAAAAQLAVGKSQYAAACSACHGQSLGGRDPAPALQGSAFLGRWTGRAALELFQGIRATMPLSAPHSLSDDNYTAIVAYLLDANGNTPAVELDLKTLESLIVTTRRDPEAH